MAVLPGGASTSRPPEAGRGCPSSSQLSPLWFHRVGCSGCEDVLRERTSLGVPTPAPGK